MSSINTNAAAMTALQTLKATNKNMDVTQNRISTGYRVSEAAHNAAYWSIATTMRSDNNAMSTVKDALGLGAAQVDVAYTAMDVVKDTLDEMKKKIVAASQPDIDTKKIQEEIKQLQNDLQTYAKSATFSGGNWLDVEETGTQKVVASFVRDASGAVSLQTIDVNTAGIALFVAGEERGLLQKVIVLPPAETTGETPAPGTVPGPDVSTLGDTQTVSQSDNEDFTIAGFTGLDWQDGDSVTFAVDFDGTEVEYTGSFNGTAWNFNVSNGTVPSGFTVTFDHSDPDDLVINIAGDGTVAATTDITIGGFESADRPETPAAPITVTGPAGGTVADGDAANFIFEGFGDTEWTDGSTVSFTLNDGTDDVVVTGTLSEGEWEWDHEEITDVGLGFSINADGNLVLNIANDTAGSLNFAVSDVTSNLAAGELTVTTFDITKLDRNQLQALLNAVDATLSEVTTAASDLGAIKTRIASQQDFVGKLMDAVSRGVGQLVDADMTEESTRLQALQVQQQLGIQALSIANGNSQNILSLFRG